MTRAASWPLKFDAGDTVWMGAIDAEGRAVSFIQSVYWEFGSGCVLPRTGVLMQNRGASFSLDPSAVNPLRPGRRPFHTLNPPLGVFDDGRVMAYGAMGGDGQPQFQAQVLTRYRAGQNLVASARRAALSVRPHLGRAFGQRQAGGGLRRWRRRRAGARRPRNRMGAAGRRLRPCRGAGARTEGRRGSGARSALGRRGGGGVTMRLNVAPPLIRPASPATFSRFAREGRAPFSREAGEGGAKRLIQLRFQQFTFAPRAAQPPR